MMPTLYFQTKCKVKGAYSYEKRISEKSGLQLGYYQFKFLGLHLGLETCTNLLLYLAYVFQNITSFTEILFELSFVCNRPSREFICAFC